MTGLYTVVYTTVHYSGAGWRPPTNIVVTFKVPT